ncbi:HET-domain-containing protein [Massarina eburnea CBS 473.64]|uniref:HET-domain-containing protein n=1 Tax=Massarina eburnea CBS 473.64 TaxID=1395130 RepID=A0A6A6RMH2_9PLEO|nr:HET-domain-containing protein [Massarina eburnea CBS 473.64]
MVLCRPCASIDLETATVYLLAQIDHIVASAEKGCQGCIFLNEAFDEVDVYLEEREDQNSWVVLRRLRRNLNRVDVHLVNGLEEDARDEEVADLTERTDPSVELRLCSVNGVERCLAWDIVAEEDELPGRIISAHADYDECLDVAKGWLKRCSQTHGPACALEQDGPLPTRLVYIPKEHHLPLQLRHTEGMTGQYITLSYVWGQGTVFKTTRENITSRQQGFWPKDLPKSVRDAVKITRRMGFEYIWIDAICIIQGDVDDWTYESALMARVYGNSVLTIQADVARDTDDGILQPRRLLRSHCFGPHESLCLQELEMPWASLTSGFIYPRGWALQERVLSVRVLHFLRDQIAWECNTTIYQEGYHGRQTYTDAHFGKFGFTKQLHQHPAIVNKADLLDHISAWNSMVQELAIRRFTIPSDRLPGISGIAAALRLPELGEYFAGVWEWNPFFSMAWHCRWSQKTPSVYRSPSWSWVWTKYQINWHPETWRYVSPEIEEAWAVWDAKWGPKLVDRDIRLQGANTRGNVLEGSSITARGACRKIFIEEEQGTEYDWEGFCFYMNMASPKGSKVFLDYKPNYLEPKCCFCKEGSDSVTWDDEHAVREYLCLQILKERKQSEFNPKVIGLLLTEAEEGSFRRVGIVAFDFEEEDGWERRSLKLV